MLDVIVRNGLIVDGTGLPAYRGDVGVAGGKLVTVGRSLAHAEAHHLIDATDKVVSPGFIDPHTHYDAQVCFDPFVYPAIEHGVTSVVTGNCSLSLAPLRAAHRSAFSAMFRLIEEMPAEAFDSGVDWRWGEGFGSMVDALSGQVALNVAPLVGHSVLRMYVLGDDAKRAATPAEVRAMCDALRACLDAGAIGLSTSYVDMDPTLAPVPSRWARHSELEALCAVLGERGRMLQVVHEFFDAGLTVSRIEMLGELSRRYGIATTLSPLFHNDSMGSAVTRVLEAVEQQWATGARVWPQVQTRPIDISWTLDQRSLMFLIIPGWWPVLSLETHADRMAAFRDPATRESLVAGLNMLASVPSVNMTLDPAHYVVRQVALDTNADLVGRTLGDIARERSTTPAELLIDLSVQEDLGTWFIRADIGHTNPGAVGEMLAHPYVHIGASDGGAHVGSFATYGDTGWLFSQFVRRHCAMRLEDAVKKITADTAAIWGMHDRGVLEPGKAADLVVFDPDTIDRGPEVASHDFPGSTIRWIRRQVGVHHVVVNGTPTWSAAEGYRSTARSGVVGVR
jgi:N-acyl-D-aspartate/D-glutamate deacylase